VINAKEYMNKMIVNARKRSQIKVKRISRKLKVEYLD
jgi:hypothetical protein